MTRKFKLVTDNSLYPTTGAIMEGVPGRKGFKVTYPSGNTLFFSIMFDPQILTMHSRFKKWIEITETDIINEIIGY